MAGFFTDFANNKVLDLFFGAQTYASPSTLYVGLSQGTSNKAGSVSEPTGGGYVRVAVTNNLTNFSAAASGTKSNATQVTFPAASAGWGTIQSLFVADALTGGNVLAMADLSTPKAISAGGSPATLAAGALFLSHT